MLSGSTSASFIIVGIFGAVVISIIIVMMLQHYAQRPPAQRAPAQRAPVFATHYVNPYTGHIVPVEVIGQNPEVPETQVREINYS